MANEATAELYRRQSGLNKAKLNTDYEQYLADLASKYGISNDQLNANLESRGILRSGEAGTARTRLSAAEEAARTSARTNYDYNVATEDIDLATRLASLLASSPGAGGGGSTGGGNGSGNGSDDTGSGDTADPAPMYRSPADPFFDNMRNRGPRPVVRPERAPGSPGNPNAVRPGVPAPAVRPVRDATPRPPVPATVVNMPRPGTTPAPQPVVTPVYGGGNTQGQLPQVALPTPAVRPVRDATPRPAVPATVANMPRPGTTPAPAPRPVVTPVYSGGTTQGSLPQAPLPTTPALPDLSGVDWAALARMGTPKPAPKPAVVTKPATTTRPTRGAGWSGKR